MNVSFKEDYLEATLIFANEGKRTFSANINFSLENSNYIVKIADEDQEFEEMLRLRYDIFYKEWGSLETGNSIDFDKYDLLADHVLIKEKKNNRIIATCRLIHSQFTDSFYSEEEFFLDEFLKSPGAKLEMGRVCIAEDYRTGVVLSLMWRALARYCTLSGVDYLFGCSSIHTTNPAVARDLSQHFMNGYSSSEYNVRPLPYYDFSDLMDNQNESTVTTEIDQLIPPILKFYLKSGAKIYGRPAIDRVFQCVDFFTILKIEEGESFFFTKYLKEAH